MSGKWFFILSILCACAYGLADHAPTPNRGPIGKHEANPKPRPKRSVTERDDATDNEGEGVEDGSEDFAPETVLSVHYDRGLIQKLYLSQTRGKATETSPWIPSVSERKQICQDLCQAGLGGDPCGYSCDRSTPDLLKELTPETRAVPRPHDDAPGPNKNSGKESGSSEETTVVPVEENPEGTPRSDVCPALCASGLGQPLCTCDTTDPQTSWPAVCQGFCNADSTYQLSGCPTCKAEKATATDDKVQTLSAPPSDFWIQWCKIQCKNGEGGAACNCDLAPMSFSMKNH